MTRIHVLSERASCSHISWANNFELEDILVETCDATILAPGQHFSHTRLEPITGRVRQGRYRKVDAPTEVGADLLLLIGMAPSALRMLKAIPGWRSRYSKVAAYIIDIYPPSEQLIDRKLASQLDALFVSYSQMVDPIQALTGVPTHFLPQAADVLGTGGFNPDKRIDVAAFGRQPAGVLEEVIRTFSSPDSPYVAWWSQQTSPYSRNMAQDRIGFLSLLRRSRISLCYRFEDSHQAGYRGVSPITARWFEAAAAGCVIVGSRPSSPEGVETLAWPDAVIEVDPSGSEANMQLRELLSDSQHLEKVGLANFRAAADAHDWRHRIGTLLESLGEERPDSLTASIRELEAH